MYGLVPPLAVPVAEPVEAPLQVTEVELALIVNIPGCNMLNKTDELQPVRSVTVAVYNPAHKLLIVLFVFPVLQLKEYGLLPPVPSIVICPVHTPLQVSEVVETIRAVTPFELFTLAEPLVAQPLPSVTVIS